MRNRFSILSVSILGGLNGAVFGCLLEAIQHLYIWYEKRRISRIAIGSGEFICTVDYPVHWWKTPLTFMFVFAVVSIVVHKFWIGSSPSIIKLWQKVGFVGSGAIVLYVFSYDLFVRMVFNPAAVAIYSVLFIVAAGFNYIFGMFVRMVAGYVARSKKTSLS